MKALNGMSFHRIFHHINVWLINISNIKLLLFYTTY